jgi:hypothetical protein
VKEFLYDVRCAASSEKTRRRQVSLDQHTLVGPQHENGQSPAKSKVGPPRAEAQIVGRQPTAPHIYHSCERRCDEIKTADGLTRMGIAPITRNDRRRLRQHRQHCSRAASIQRSGALSLQPVAAQLVLSQSRSDCSR